ncbi:hypothetical protein [Streptomyces sp. NPDC001068]|uniref:hypothetical protein n=1 Tax=Streptomyces sp. NPDC001068 TaxID=3364544 RepID=UPI0036C4A3B6
MTPAFPVAVPVPTYADSGAGRTTVPSPPPLHTAQGARRDTTHGRRAHPLAGADA